ncbi:LOW QUALITY PROTEIN: isochorismatase domain-containing protein 2-like [Uloborus diversus]|uniref:LOW QUALITY PROTEIN: isochorismatase domain-containing protein 2-like n=1 Tax=Uloborus diversus TaxID=327109 RepID=UPI00240A38AD|nr:LOW QUALITY PROTEIN: isochorismatase domain-containing protein 2-like [Uloborus diversus]
MSNIRKLKQLIPRATAFFLCDMQEKFASNIQYFPAIANVASRVLKAAKMLEMPVIVTEQYPKGLGRTVKEIGLADYPDIIPFEKTQFNMLTPAVHEFLKTMHPSVESVIISGIESHVCVQCTVECLINHGYDVHVLADGCSSRTMVDRMYSFQRMKAMGAWLTTSESVILGLAGDAAHPKFKDLQRLIREPAPDSGLLSLLQQPTL